MPLYEYECKECKNNFEIVESIHAASQTHCSVCEANSLFRVIHLPIGASAKGEPKTIAQLADKNWKNMGSYERQDRMQADKIPETIAKRERKANLDRISNMSEQQKTKYIMEGD